MARSKKQVQAQSDEIVYDLTAEEEEFWKSEREVKCMSAIVKKGKVSLSLNFLPDELISGSDQGFGQYEAVLRTPGEYKRGELLMMDGNQFVKATSEGIASAKSLVILDENIEVGEEKYAEVLVYSSGRFMASKVILPYETESDSHEELIEALKPLLLPMKIYLD